jgi:hypothetical protein
MLAEYRELTTRLRQIYERRPSDVIKARIAKFEAEMSRCELLLEPPRVNQPPRRVKGSR